MYGIYKQKYGRVGQSSEQEVLVQIEKSCAYGCSCTKVNNQQIRFQIMMSFKLYKY